MKAKEREIRRKKRILDHAVESGNVAKTCRYFGIPRSSFYRWRNVYLERGEEGLPCARTIARLWSAWDAPRGAVMCYKKLLARTEGLNKEFSLPGFERHAVNSSREAISSDTAKNKSPMLRGL